MIIGYELGVYLAVASLAIACVISVLRGFSAARTLATLLVSLYVPALLTIELLPLSIGWDPMLSHNLGIFPIPFTLIVAKWEELAESQLGLFCLGLAKMTIPLLPLGLLAPIIWQRFRPLQSISLLLMVASFGIELVQLMEDAIMGAFSKRISFDEALLAFIGGLVGYGLWMVTSRIVAKSSKAGIASN